MALLVEDLHCLSSTKQSIVVVGGMGKVTFHTVEEEELVEIAIGHLDVIGEIISPGTSANPIPSFL